MATISNVGPTEAVVPGFNGKIAFQSGTEIFVMNPDGSGKVNITNSSAIDRNPSWSPDGTKIAFERQDNGTSQIFAMNHDGSGQTNLSANTEFEGDPTWSPDGSRIAFVNFGNEIYVMNADGSGRVNLTNHPAIDIAPSWSPDGTKIAFASLRELSQVMVMNADGSGQVNVSNSSTNDLSPAWSPDGTKIAFGRDDDLWVMNADGSGQTRITTAPGFEGSPAWSPDGRKITFVSRPIGEPDLDVLVMNADGTGVVSVADSPARETDPDWQALGPEQVADMRVSVADAPDPVVAGKDLGYTITVVNDGPATTAATLVDRLPASAAFVSASAGCRYDEPSHSVTCGTPPLAAGGSGTATVVVRPTVGGTLTNVVEVAGAVTDPDPADNTASATTTVHGPQDVPAGCTNVPPHAQRPPVCR